MKTGSADVRETRQRPEHLGKRRHLSEDVKAIANLRHPQLTEIAIQVLDEMCDFVSGHGGERRGNALRRQGVVPLMSVVTTLARQHRLRVEVRLEIGALYQFPISVVADTATSLGRVFQRHSTH